MIGERVWDVMRAIDLLGEQPEVEADRIACMGNSGGGTVTFYAACLDPRVKLAVVSCAFCAFSDCLMRIQHCGDNYIPGMLRVAEMGELAGLIAPRGIIVVAGEQDEIFPIAGVRAAFETASSIFEAAGCPEHVRLVVGEGGHRFYAEPTWPVIHELMPGPD
jgi:dienelactone hydrolase